MPSSWLYKRGRIWWYGWRDDGRKQDAKSLKTQDAVRAEILRDEEDKKLNAKETGLSNKNALWDTVRTDFLSGYKEGKTKEGHLRSLALFEEYTSPSKISSPTYQDAKGFRDHLQTAKSVRGKPYSPTSINIHIRNLTTFFNEAVRAKYITESPFAEVKQVPEVKRTPRYIQKEQVLGLIAEADTSWPPDKVLMLKTFLYTGIRLSELVNLRWSSIDLKAEIFFLHGSENWAPKDREEHAIGLHLELKAGFKKLPKISEYVFPGTNGKPRDKDATRSLFNRLYKRAGIKETGCHLIRHTFATHSLLPIRALQKVLGHADVKTTERYRHVTKEHLEEMKKMTYR